MKSVWEELLKCNNTVRSTKESVIESHVADEAEISQSDDVVVVVARLGSWCSGRTCTSGAQRHQYLCQ